MRRLLLTFVALALAASPARGAKCMAKETSDQPHWIPDHYRYDSALHRDWQVLVDCSHPAAPARMRLAPGTHAVTHHDDRVTAAPVVLHAGTAVEVSSAPNSPAAIRLSGTAMQTAFAGQPVRVRLTSNGRFVTAVVRGSRSVELLPTQKPRWGQP